MVRVALDKFVTKTYTSETDDLIATFLLRAGLLEKGARGAHMTPSSEHPTFIGESGGYAAEAPNASVILRMANYSREHKGWAAALITPALLAWPGSADRDHAEPGPRPPTLEVVRTSVEASLAVGERGDEKDAQISTRKVRKAKKRQR